jgi:hypothetical protein
MLKKIVLFIPLCILIFSSCGEAWEKMSHTDEMSFSAENVRKVSFEGIDFAELTYTGEENRREFDVTVTYKARVEDAAELAEIISELDFEIVESDNLLTMRMSNLKRRNSGLLKKLLPQVSKRRVILHVKGPAGIDLEINSDFSDIITRHTAGELIFNADFATVNAIDHNGRLNANIDFGDLTAEELVGSFNLSLEFCKADVAVEYLGGDSRASIEFGDIDIDIPGNTDAEFHISKSFGGVDFDLSRPVDVQGEDNRRVTLNSGDNIVKLSAEFGSITVRDTIAPSAMVRNFGIQ